MRVLAIDPGYDRVGVAVIEKTPSGERLLHSACIVTDRAEPFIVRLGTVAEAVIALIEQHHPTHFAIENLFLSNNQKTAMRVAEARGVLLYLAHTHNLVIHEFTPLEIKAAITGDGKSPKDRMQRILPKLIRIDNPIKYDDEWDAIAVGLTCLAHARSH